MLEAQALSLDGMCRDASKSNVNLEVFQDNIDKAVDNESNIDDKVSKYYNLQNSINMTSFGKVRYKK